MIRGGLPLVVDEGVVSSGLLVSDGTPLPVSVGISAPEVGDDSSVDEVSVGVDSVAESVGDSTEEDSVEDSAEASVEDDSMTDDNEDGEKVEEEVFKKGPMVGIGTGSVFVFTGA